LINGGNSDLELRRALAGRRNDQRRKPAGEGESHHQRRETRDVTATARGNPADDGTGEDGDKGRAFHQRIAGGQFLAP
jgi:hypothetical protein